MILDRIVSQKRIQLEEEKKSMSIEGWKQRLKRPGLHGTADFYNSIKIPGNISIIAEVKKASPSKGIIKADFDPAGIAKQYDEAGVQAVSVLTEKNYFMGSNNNLVKIRQSVPLPLLRKDFIIDIWQVYESRYIGADAILLIASLLSKEQLKRFQVVAKVLGMQCLVEIHNIRELEKVLQSGAKIIGINNRNLKNFKVNLKTTAEIINNIPRDRAVVSESGISTKKDVYYLRELGADAILVGESFMKAASIVKKVKELSEA